MPSRNRQHKSKKNGSSNKSQYVDSLSETKPAPEVKIGKPWTPTSYTAFKALLSARLCAAVWSNISDCDEVFNYWEPMHYMLYGTGFQTWEYSPMYAIRSYAYILLHVVPGYIYSYLLQSNKVLVFYFTRCLLGFISAACEVYFYRAVCQHFGANIGRLTLLFLIFGSGMFISSAAFLPSTFSMYLSTIALAAWFTQQHEITILATAASVILGWPFAAILSLPAAIDIVFVKREFSLFVRWTLVGLGSILIPVVLLDTYYFGKFVIAPLNIVLYNVFTSHGPDLYGTEPWSFYFMNGFLNFNFGFLAALMSIPAVVFVKQVILPSKKSQLMPSFVLCLTPMYLWMFVFFIQSHKEERFLFPIFPMLCLAAAVTVDCIQKLYFHFFVKEKIFHYLDSTNWISLVFCIVYTVLCLSRTVMTYRAYHAPIETFMELNRISVDESLHPLPPELPVSVCVGKEWYRFPSNFFLPPNWKLQFLKSDFRGQLPKPYSNVLNATRIIPTHMNDQNLEEPSRYIDLKRCDYIIDSDVQSDSPLEPNYSRSDQWKVIHTIAFLDSQRCFQLFRAFYIPYFSDYKCAYVDYNLLQSTKILERLFKKKRKLSHNL